MSLIFIKERAPMERYAWPSGGHRKYFCIMGAHGNLYLAFILIGTVSYCPLQILLITWPIGRPPAERPGIPKGRSPLGHNVTTFKILQKKGNYRGSPTYAVFTSADPTILVFGLFKVHISWEGHKILQNLHLTFVLCSASQK